MAIARTNKRPITSWLHAESVPPTLQTRPKTFIRLTILGDPRNLAFRWDPWHRTAENSMDTVASFLETARPTLRLHFTFTHPLNSWSWICKGDGSAWT